MINTVIALLLIIAITFYVYFKKWFSYWKYKKVVTLPVLPIVGSYGKVLLFRKHIGIIMKDCYDMYPEEKYIGGFRGHRPQLIVLDPEVIRSITVKHFNHFSDRGDVIDENNVLDHHLSNLSGDKWRLLRQKLTTIFTSAKMKLMFPLIAECGEDLQKYVRNSLEKSDVIEAKETMAKYTTDTIGSCVFGIRMNSMGDKEGMFRKIGQKMGQNSGNFYACFLSMISKMMPKIYNHSVRSPQIERFFVGLVKELIAIRETPSNRHDFIDLLMELKIKGHLTANKNEDTEESIQITDELITAQVFLFFGAGFSTSSSTMSFVLRELALNPRVQEKLLNEIDAVLKRSDGQLTYDAVNEVQYLNMVIDETLRKYPPAPTIERQCTSKYTIPNTDIVIDEGVCILIPVYGLHHDSKYFPNPGEFIPERFSKDAEKTYHSYAYLPFGEGPRNCIGMRFARLQMVIGLISLLSKYKVEKCDQTKQEVNFRPTGLALHNADSLWLRVTPRS